MTSYFDDKLIRKSWIDYPKPPDIDGWYEMDRLFNVIAEINKERRIFTDLPEPLGNLAYNALYIQVFQRLNDDYYEYIDYDYTTDILISKIIDSTKHIDMFMDIIIKSAEELDSEDKKQAFYKLMGNNHIIMAEVYKLRRDFFNSSINILCEKEGIPKLDDKMTSEESMIKLCELTKSKECSRLQKALDILIKYGDNLTITDENGKNQSNATKLGISKDDIYSLQLLKNGTYWDNLDLNLFLEESVYNSFFIIDRNENSWKFPIYNLYNRIFKICLDINIIYLGSIKDTKPYITQNINEIKKYLSGLKNKESMRVLNEIGESTIFNVIKDHKEFKTDEFTNNVLQNYLNSIESIIHVLME
ncbi:hypothetical protein NEIRO03_2623 [Nematocida sp. AWRm78]|nr:hypothetical protein NEIRO02_2619 [Nematocida sp. AWRm79]KAI5187888.1 hypothetical protein NEIRO03_2623 [Nematocida sp. AWRm78]